jgi:DNA-binding transcriptional MerR regulator
VTASPATPADVVAPSSATLFRIGEVAKLTGLTTRTLRYWEELGLVAPSSYGTSGDRHYTATDMTRVTRIRDLQKLLGFSLAEVRVVLDTEDVDVLDRIRSELHSGDPSPARQRQLIEEAVEANDRLLARLDDTLARIDAFRSERLATAGRLRVRLQALDATDPAPTPDPAPTLHQADRAPTKKARPKP